MKGDYQWAIEKIGKGVAFSYVDGFGSRHQVVGELLSVWVYRDEFGLRANIQVQLDGEKKPMYHLEDCAFLA